MRFSNIKRVALCLGAAGTVLTWQTANAGAASADHPNYGITIAESPPPSWPQPPRAPAGAPNILVILTDDVGFGTASGFGGPVPTPNFDALARQGLRYNHFMTTAICSPTRAALLTGRNPQNVGIGYPTNWASGYDGYNSVIPKSAGTLPRILRDNGYATAMFGKGHITPEWELGPNGPFDRWPTGLGFQYYYGFLGADTSQVEPSLVENERQVAVPTGPDYHLDKDLADHAIRWIAEGKAAEPDKPFFVYFSTGAAHAPNQAPAEWLARFRGKFDAGWDVARKETVQRQKALGLIPADTVDAPRPANLQNWEELSASDRANYSRMMEAYAAQLAYADFQIGRVIDSLRASGQIDNTLIVFIQGDNGASAEGGFAGKMFEQSGLAGAREDPAWIATHRDEIGGPNAYSLIPGGWGWALNAPFPWAKRYASHFGGTRNGMVLSWPGRIQDPGGIRRQVMHVSDVMPTLLDIVGIKAPATIDGVRQQPIDGISAAYSLRDAQAPSARRTQVFGIAQNLAIYHDGWVAATRPMVTPWDKTRQPQIDPRNRTWELYNTKVDFSQSQDIAAANPGKLKEMVSLFWKEAPKAGILPIHSSEGQQEGRPDPNRDRNEFTYTTPIAQFPETVAPRVVGNSFTISADVMIPAQGQGAIAAQGGRFGGYALFLDGGRPGFTYTLTPEYRTRIVAEKAIAPGQHRLDLDFLLDREAAGSPATVVLRVDGAEVARGRVPQTFARVVSHSEGFDVGQDLVSPVDSSYTAQTSTFSGKLGAVRFRIGR